MRRMIPYSVDITGNFVYSPQLIEARKQVQEGLLNAAQLLEIENKEIQHIVDTCKQIGLKCVTDGDYRSNGYTDFFHHLQNISKHETEPNDTSEENDKSVICGKIDFDNHFLSTHFTYLTGIIGGDMYAKALLPSPMTLLAELIRPENRLNTGRYYPDIEVLSHDIAQTYQKVIREFYNMGCRFLQFSDYTWNLTGGCDIQQISEANNTDLASLSTVLARLTELCLNDKPDDMCISLQFDEKWWNTRDREKIAEILLSTQANAIAFDFGNRENENIDFSILKHCQSKDVILGLVSTSSSQPISTSTHSSYRKCCTPSTIGVSSSQLSRQFQEFIGKQFDFRTRNVEQNSDNEKYCKNRLGRIKRASRFFYLYICKKSTPTNLRLNRK